MAADVAETTVVKPETKMKRATPRGQLYFGRFYTVYVVLGLVVAAAIIGVALAVKATVGAGGGGGAALSTWQPTGGGLGLAEQIAAHVGKEYRIANGDQLDAVLAKGPVAVLHGTKFKIEFVAIRGRKGAADVVFNTSSSDTVFYSLSGLGASGAILEGTPSVGRARFVQQEIAELALYTFRYNSAIHDIVAFMPPVGTVQPAIVFLHRSDLAPYLSGSLATTLRPATRLAARSVYSWNFQLEQDGSGIFVLTKLHTKQEA